MEEQWRSSGEAVVEQWRSSGGAVEEHLYPAVEVYGALCGIGGEVGHHVPQLEYGPRHRASARAVGA